MALEAGDRVAMQKPAGWRVDYDSLASAGLPLSGFLRSLRPIRHAAIADDSSCRFGFMHRLDVPGSGLILAAQSYEAYLDLQLQLSIGDLHRSYLVLCHGWMPPGWRAIRTRIAAPHLQSSAVSPSGKASITWLQPLARARVGGSSFSLVAIRIATGRRHQIRVQTAHVGHPTASDGRYTSQEVFQSDTAWCPDNFLHRYHLAFYSRGGRALQVSAPLPPELARAVHRFRSIQVYGVRGHPAAPARDGGAAGSGGAGSKDEAPPAVAERTAAAELAGTAWDALVSSNPAPPPPLASQGAGPQGAARA